MNGRKTARTSQTRPAPLSTLQVAEYGCTPVLGLPDGWRRYVHINGGVYHHHARKGIIVECDMSDERNRRLVMEDREEVLQRFEDEDTMRYVPEGAELIMRYVVDEELGSSPELAEAFFVCHREMKEVKRTSYPSGKLRYGCDNNR